MKAVEAKVDEVGVVFDREEERKELAPITVISTISLEVNTLKNLLRCHFDHLNNTLRDQQQYTLPHQSFFYRRTTRETRQADG